MGTKRVKILVIEDDMDDYLLLQGLLSNAPASNFELEWAQDS